MVVHDNIRDETSRIADLQISTFQPTTLAIDAGHYFVIPAANQCRERTVFYSALRDPKPTNAEPYLALHLDVLKEDARVPNFKPHACGVTMPTAPDDTLGDFASLTATNGFYPLNVPLEIGKFESKSVTITVGRPNE